MPPLQPTWHRGVQGSVAGGGSRFIQLWAAGFRRSGRLWSESAPFHLLNCWVKLGPPVARAPAARHTTSRPRGALSITTIWLSYKADMEQTRTHHSGGVSRNTLRRSVPPPPRVCPPNFPDLSLTGAPLLSSMHLTSLTHIIIRGFLHRLVCQAGW